MLACIQQTNKTLYLLTEIARVLSYFLLWCSQGFVLGPLLFIMCITPLSTLISSISLDHHIYADDTSSSSLSTHSTLTQAFLTFKTFFNRSLPG